jgi:AcrR family transcriptional regulator
MTAESNGGRGRRTAEAARQTRATIIENAAEAFAETGYLQTSIRDLAQRSGLSTGAIYRHFRNKAELLGAVLREEMAAEVEEPAPRGPTDPFLPAVETAARRQDQRRRLRALLVQGAAAAPTDAETQAQLGEEIAEHLDLWVEEWEQFRDEFAIDPEVDLRAMVFYQWAAEVGLGLCEAMGLEPPAEGWPAASIRFARSWQLPPLTPPHED